MSTRPHRETNPGRNAAATPASYDPHRPSFHAARPPPAGMANLIKVGQSAFLAGWELEMRPEDRSVGRQAIAAAVTLPLRWRCGYVRPPGRA